MLTTIVCICKDEQQFLEFSERSHGNAVINFLKSFEKNEKQERVSQSGKIKYKSGNHPAGICKTP